MTEELTLQVDESKDVEVGEVNVLPEGDYVICVPPGQRATVTYELIDETLTRLDAGE
jgi:hypothetical protein